jgi:hypothetical protein
MDNKLTDKEKLTILINYIKSLAICQKSLDQVKCNDCRETIFSADIILDEIGEK